MTRLSIITKAVQSAQAGGKIVPMIIAGPCSAETEEQVLETARQLKKQNILKMMLLTLFFKKYMKFQ